MKRCSRCGLSKERRDFYRNAGWKDGLHPYCKSCLLAYQADHWRRFGVRKTSRRWASTLGVVDDYFAEIDTPTKAYLLGLLAADGCVLNRPNWNQIYLELATKDRCLLELLRREVAPEVPIRTRWDRGGRSCVLAFSSARLKQDLCAHGVVPQKTYSLRWPEALPEWLEWSYVLGYFDGDGWFSVDPRGRVNYPHWRVLGTREFLFSMRERVAWRTGVLCRAPRARTDGTVSFLLQVAGQNARTLDRWMHQDPHLGLTRKRLDLLENQASLMV